MVVLKIKKERLKERRKRKYGSIEKKERKNERKKEMLRKKEGMIQPKKKQKKNRSIYWKEK